MAAHLGVSLGCPPFVGTHRRDPIGGLSLAGNTWGPTCGAPIAGPHFGEYLVGPYGGRHLLDPPCGPPLVDSPRGTPFGGHTRVPLRVPALSNRVVEPRFRTTLGFSTFSDTHQETSLVGPHLAVPLGGQHLGDPPSGPDLEDPHWGHPLGTRLGETNWGPTWGTHLVTPLGGYPL